MDVPVSEAKAQLTDLIRRAEAGEAVVLTRHGVPVVQLTPIARTATAAQRREVLASVRRACASLAKSGPSAAESQDFLYDATGLPR